MKNKLAIICGILSLAVLISLMTSAVGSRHPAQDPVRPTQQEAMVKALQLLAKATERQAIAFEKLAKQASVNKPVPVRLSGVLSIDSGVKSFRVRTQ